LSWLTGGTQRRKAVLTLAVPRDCRVELRVVSAGLMVGGLAGPGEAHPGSGEITRAGLRGPVKAESVSGPVQASGVTGDLSARTVSGDLTVAEGGGGSVKARTVAGAGRPDARASRDRVRRPDRGRGRRRVGQGPDRLGGGRPRPPGLRRPRHPPVQRLGRPHGA